MRTGQICTKGHFCTKTFLNKDTFARIFFLRVNLQENKIDIKNNKNKLSKYWEWEVTRGKSEKKKGIKKKYKKSE